MARFKMKIDRGSTATTSNIVKFNDVFVNPFITGSTAPWKSDHITAIGNFANFMNSLEQQIFLLSEFDVSAKWMITGMMTPDDSAINGFKGFEIHASLPGGTKTAVLVNAKVISSIPVPLLYDPGTVREASLIGFDYVDISI